MKKLRYIMLFATIMLGGCQHQEYYYTSNEDILTSQETTSVVHEESKVTVSSSNGYKENASINQNEEIQSPKAETEVEIMHPDEPVEKLVYDSAYDRFLDNVVIKARSENYVTYEYKDVRVDELAPLASRYCQEHGNRTADLRDGILYKNYARRATFDCLRLQ